MDDEKFIDSVVYSMETVNPSRNKYLVGLFENNYVSKYPRLNDRLFIAKYGSKLYSDILGDLNSYQAVVIHLMNEPKFRILKTAPAGIRFVWNIWGMDFYGLLSPTEYPLYDEQTELYLVKRASRTYLDYSIRSSFLFKFYIHYKKKLQRYISKKYYRKISFYSTVLPEEKALVNKHLDLPASYVPFSYGFTDEQISAAISYKEVMDTQNVFLGNSGTPANNHINLISRLSKFNLKNRRVLTPLSYGDKEYIYDLIKFGRGRLRNNFEPIIDFMPFHEYIKRLKTCKVCIMGHYRQQGVGNIILMILFGAKVYLSTRNPFYKFCIKRGMRIFSIENDLMSLSHDLFSEISSAEVRQNKKAILEYFGQNAVLERNRKFIEKISASNGLAKDPH